MRLWPRAVDDRGRAYAFDVSTVQSWRERTKRKSGVPLVLGSVALVPGLAVFIALDGRVPQLLRYALALAATGPFFYASGLWMRRKDIRDSTRLGRARGQCLACGYDIADIEPQEDNRRVCPECGSAWKLDADTAPAASQPERPER